MWTKKELKQLSGVCLFPHKKVNGEYVVNGIGAWQSGGVEIVVGSAALIEGDRRLRVTTGKGGPANPKPGLVLDIPVNLIAFTTYESRKSVKV